MRDRLTSVQRCGDSVALYQYQGAIYRVQKGAVLATAWLGGEASTICLALVPFVWSDRSRQRVPDIPCLQCSSIALLSFKFVPSFPLPQKQGFRRSQRGGWPSPGLRLAGSPHAGVARHSSWALVVFTSNMPLDFSNSPSDNRLSGVDIGRNSDPHLQYAPVIPLSLVFSIFRVSFWSVSSMHEPDPSSVPCAFRDEWSYDFALKFLPLVFLYVDGLSVQPFSANLQGSTIVSDIWRWAARYAVFPSQMDW